MELKEQRVEAGGSRNGGTFGTLNSRIRTNGFHADGKLYDRPFERFLSHEDGAARIFAPLLWENLAIKGTTYTITYSAVSLALHVLSVDPKRYARNHRCEQIDDEGSRYAGPFG